MVSRSAQYLGTSKDWTRMRCPIHVLVEAAPTVYPMVLCIIITSALTDCFGSTTPVTGVTLMTPFCAVDFILKANRADEDELIRWNSPKEWSSPGTLVKTIWAGGYTSRETIGLFPTTAKGTRDLGAWDIFL